MTTVAFPEKFLSLLIVLLFIPIPGVFAQIEDSSVLFQTLVKNDSLLFIEGFNKCNGEKYEHLIAEDLEFYHDTGGFQDRKEFLKAVDQNICSNFDVKPIRKLVKGSLQVFPLNENGNLYGAIQMGEHEFYIKEPGKELSRTGFARFTHLWILEEGQWFLKRVLSYDHKGID